MQLDPVTSQPFAMLPSQFRVPPGQGVQAPPAHVWTSAVHAEVDPHVPVPEHVCTPLPEHCVEPGTQTPTQAFVTHADDTHGVLLPQVPLVEHVSRLFSTHRFVVGVHTPVQVPPTQA
jgi:hypothetical protein